MSQTDLTTCKACGHQISKRAAACPSCGDPTGVLMATLPPPTKGMSTGSKVVVAGLCLFLLYSCVSAFGGRSSGSTGAATTGSAPASQSYKVTVVSVNCRSDYGRDRADITVRNTGTETIPYAKAFVEFTTDGGKVVSADDSYFSPTDIPPGATASATVYAGGGGADKCGMTAIQDGDGNQVSRE
jgi:hypothetical protein